MGSGLRSLPAWTRPSAKGRRGQGGGDPAMDGCQEEGCSTTSSILPVEEVAARASTRRSICRSSDSPSSRQKCRSLSACSRLAAVPCRAASSLSAAVARSCL